MPLVKLYLHFHGPRKKQAIFFSLSLGPGAASAPFRSDPTRRLHLSPELEPFDYRPSINIPVYRYYLPPSARPIAPRQSFPTMRKRSHRPPTRIGRGIPSSAKISGIGDFVRALRLAGVDRVMTEDITTMRTTKIGGGSQFTVYDDTGVGRYLNFPSAVMKCANVELDDESVARGDENRDQKVLDTLQRELVALTHPALRQHANISRLLLYDLITSSSGKSIPTLVVERAKFGSLYDLLERGQHTVMATDRADICKDITAGLSAIHRAGIVHGDVKADNVLIFESPEQNKQFLAKISDFGSIITVDDAKEIEKRGGQVRYNGTKSTNAPETVNQSGRNAIAADMLVRCDMYSLGLVYLHVLAGRWERDWEAKDDRILEQGIDVVKRSDLPQEVCVQFCEAIGKILQYDPEKRCADLTTVLEALTPNQPANNLATASAPTPTSRPEIDVNKSIELKFGRSDYLDFGWHDEMLLAKDIQHDIFVDSQATAALPEFKQSSRSCFELALAYSIGFGTEANVDKALNMMLEAARRQYLPARAMVHAWFDANEREIGVHEEVGLNWLFEATLWGSTCAGKVLQRKSLDDYLAAREEFHDRGGYNQYFYDTQPPEYIGSEGYLSTIGQLLNGDSKQHMYSLLESAVIYGDGALAKYLLQQKGADPSFRNQLGESLLLLCSKGGHLNVLEILVEHGASVDTYDADGKQVQDSPLHWLVAFDHDDKEAAANLLFHAGADLSADIAWHHPTIDYPGQFPQGTPFHFAAFCNDEKVTDILLAYHRSLRLNPTMCLSGSSQITPSPLNPIEYTTKFRRPSILGKLISAGFLESSTTRNALGDVSTLPIYAIWAANGSLGLKTDVAAEQCIDLLVRACPSLVNQPGELGFTPIMIASYNHCETATRCLISAGCDVNARTPPEYDGRNALNLYSDNQLSYKDDNIIDLLHAAGADLEQGSTSDKKPLHFAARENNIRAARRLLELGANLQSRRGFGETPLHTAALYGSVEVGRFLLEMGADTMAEHWGGGVNSKWKGLTPLAFAGSRGQKGFMKLLLEEYGVVPLARQGTRDTILHFAVCNTGEETLKMLLDIPKLKAQGLLNQKNFKGIAPLHVACCNMQRPHIELLINAGADINQLTDSGHSPLDLAHHVRSFLWGTITQEHNVPTLSPLTLTPESRETSNVVMTPSTGSVDSLERVLIERAEDHVESTACQQVIQYLEELGAHKASLQPVPEGLASLE